MSVTLRFHCLLLILLVTATSGTGQKQRIRYNLKIRTGDRRWAKTDAKVFLQIFGSTGNTSEIALDSLANDTDLFENGKTDNLVLTAKDVGKMKKIKIRHDNTKPQPGWFLEEIKMDIPSKCKQFVFDFHRWLAVGSNDKQIQAEREPSSNGNKNNNITYKVLTRTGHRYAAGTDANVYLQIFGKKKNTRDMHLKQSVNTSNLFEYGQEDYFQLEAKDVGKLTKIKIRHDNTTKNPGWYLKDVQIWSPICEESFVFDFHRWLSGTDGDKKIELEKKPSLKRW